MEAIVLAGGFGTRLQHLVNNVPKPMASVKEHPFLEYILEDLNNKGITHVVLAVGYMQEVIVKHFHSKYKNINIDYSAETQPLLTGGAVKKAISFCQGKEFFVINGDTYFDVDLQAMAFKHRNSNNLLTIAVKKMYNFDRYGQVLLANDRIIGFNEKKPCKQGYISGGIYYMNKKIIDGIQQTVFSFENDFLEKKYGELRIGAFISDGYFIDIGTEEDYMKIQNKDAKFLPLL